MTSDLMRNDDLAQRAAVGMLKRYVDLRHNIATMEKERELMAGFIKRWLEDNPGEELMDGELGIGAHLQERQGAPEYDTTSMPDAMILWAKEQHLLRMDAKMAALHIGKSVVGDDLQRYKMPGRPTVALQVEERKR